MSPIEPFQTLLQEALSPEADRGLTAVQLLGQRAVGKSIGKKQNQTRALSVGGTQATSPRPSDQLLPLFIGQDDLLRRGVHPHSLSHYAPEMGVTVHQRLMLRPARSGNGRLACAF